MFDHQKVFDTIANHLRSMPARARNPFGGFSAAGRCAYRTSEGAKCAVGVLIPDELYSPDMESWGTIRGNTLVLNALEETFDCSLKWRDISFLADLQRVHDSLNNWSDQGFRGEEQLKLFAESRGLTYTAP